MHRFLTPLLLAAWSFTAIAAEEPVPTAAPVLRDGFPAATTAADRAVAAFCLEHRGDPASGRLIAQIDAGSAAAKAGFVVGATIWAVDGKPIGIAQALPAGRHRYGLWMATRETRVVEAGDPDVVGLHLIDGTTPDAEDFAQWSRDPGPWLDDLVAAVYWRRSHPTTTLAALARAKAAGYRGHLLQTLAAVAWAACGRYDEALAAGLATVDRCPASERIAVCQALATAAFATGRYDLGSRILGKEPRLPTFSTPGTKVPRLDFGTPAARHDVGWLLAATPVDHLAESTDLPDAKVPPRVLAALRAGQPIGMHPTSDNWNSYVFGPGFADAEIELDARGALTTPTRERSGNELDLRVALVDHAQKATALSLRLENDGEVMFSAGDDTVWRLRLQQAPVAYARPRHIRLSVHGDRGAIFLDGACLWCGPMQLPKAGRTLCWEIYACGMTLDCRDIAWRELRDGAGPDELRRANLLLEVGREADADAAIDALAAKTPAMLDDAVFWHSSRNQLDRSVALLDERVHANPSDDGLALRDTAFRLLLGDDPARAIAQLGDHRSAIAAFDRPLLLLAACRRSGRAADVVGFLPADRRTRSLQLAAAHLLLESGRFAEAHAAMRALLRDPKLMEEEAAELSICDAILSPLFGDEALPHDEVTRNPFAPEVWRVSSAWLAGRIDDDTALARAGRCDAAEFLFVAGLRALAAGKHDAARASLERSARFGVPGAGGPARSLLTWYALQTAESLAKLSGTGEAKKPVDDF